jgi:hypothetical protein
MAKTELLTCTPKQLPDDLLVPAAENAVRINPVNHPRVHGMTALRAGKAPTRVEIAVITSKYWGAKGVRLTVRFLDDPETALRTKILSHMNAWGKCANVRFTYTTGQADVRIARAGGAQGGYWSYLGTDIRLIESDKPTLNLEAFTMKTPDSEFFRVVRHETGHTLGSPHEHMRRELVALIDSAKAIAYFGETQGWSADEVRAQVLTPIEESTLRGTPHADPNSIMCYQIPGSITKNGQPILGGTDIDKMDCSFMGSIYPGAASEPPKKRKTNKRATVKRTSAKKARRSR